MLAVSTLTWGSLAILAAALGVYLLYLLAMAGVLAICGVSRKDIAKWALKQADRQRFTDLIRAARGQAPEAAPPDDKSSAGKPSLDSGEVPGRSVSAQSEEGPDSGAGQEHGDTIGLGDGPPLAQP